MADKKIIAVTGATGAQGGGVVRAILADPAGGFTARAITRKVDSDKAKALAALGVEVVAGDIDDQASITRAFRGAHGAFCVTNYWEHFSPEREHTQASHLAAAAKAAGVKHVVWSTLEDTRKWIPLSDNRMPTLMGNFKVPHFDAKGESDELFRAQSVPTTFLLTSFYYENLIYFGAGPKPGPDGKLAITMPMDNAKLPLIAVEDIGKCAYAIIKRGREFIGKSVTIAGDRLSGAEMAAALTTALGKPVVYNNVPPEVYRSFGFPGADDLGNMFQFKRDFNDYFAGARDPAVARQLNPGLQSFATWLTQNKDRIPLT